MITHNVTLAELEEHFQQRFKDHIPKSINETSKLAEHLKRENQTINQSKKYRSFVIHPKA